MRYRTDPASPAAGLAILLLGFARAQGPMIAGLALARLLSGTLIENALHRFVLHALPPFSR